MSVTFVEKIINHFRLDDASLAIYAFVSNDGQCDKIIWSGTLKRLFLALYFNGGRGGECDWNVARNLEAQASCL